MARFSTSKGCVSRIGSDKPLSLRRFLFFAGENFGFIGPNGAGKTTTIACIAGLLAGWQGEMEFEGRPFAPASNVEDRRKLGVVPQNLALY